MPPAVDHAYAELAARMRSAVAQTLARAPELRLLYVTNLRFDEPTDIGPGGLTNIAQYYSEREADEIIRSFQELGLTVEPYFSEVELIDALLNGRGDDTRRQIVYTTAEGGAGSGRRALIPALCNLLGLPVLNSGAHAASLVRHKFHAFAVLRQVGVRVPDTWQYADGCWTGGLEPGTGARVLVKPAYESMGIGVREDSVQIVDDEFGSFIRERAREFGQAAIVQEFISGDEVGVPVLRLGTTYALPPIAQRRSSGERFDHLPKTFRDEHVLHDLSHAGHDAPEAQLAAIRDAAVRAFDALEMRGAGRIDFRVDADGRAWAFDTNGEPPPTANTCWSVAMERLGFPLPDLIAVWVGACLYEHGVVSGL